MANSSKKDKLSKLKAKVYQIYGIFDFKKMKLVYVNIDYEKTEMEFDLELYDDERYDIVTFSVAIS